MGKNNCENCNIKGKYKYWNEFPPTKHCFFATMTYDFEHKMKLPTKFADCFKGPLSSGCTLIGPSGNKWRVRLSENVEDDEEVFFSDGWDSFVKDHGVEVHDFLTFRYVGESSFEVAVFDASGCEREISHFAKNGSSSGTCTSTLHSEGKHDNFEDVFLSCDSSGDAARRKSERNKNKRAKIPCPEDHESVFEDYDDKEPLDGSWNLPNQEEVDSRPITRLNSWGKATSNRAKMSQMFFVSNRRELKKAEVVRASLKADDHEPKSDVPMFKLTMRPTNVYSGFNTTIPKKWAMEHMLKSAHQVVLRVPAVGKSWIVGCRWTTGSQQCQLRANWTTFVYDNTLEEHDVCVFELIKKASSGNKETPAEFDVYIYRVVDEPVSLTVRRRLV